MLLFDKFYLTKIISLCNIIIPVYGDTERLQQSAFPFSPICKTTIAKGDVNAGTQV